MGWPVVSVASGGIPVIETTRGLPVSEAANGRGVAVTKVTGKPALPVTFDTIYDTIYATFDGANSAGVVISSDGFTVTHGVIGASIGARSTALKSSGKYYFEIIAKVSSHAGNCFGIMLSTATYANVAVGLNCNEVAANAGASGAIIWANNVSTGKNLGAFVLGTDVFGVAVNFDTRKAWFRKNTGLWNATAGDDPATGVGGVVIAAGSFAPHVVFGTGGAGSDTDAFTANFGATAYANAAPAGFSNWTLP
jgi:hypothetical protein